MGPTLILFFVMVVLTTGIMYVVIRWAVSYVQRFIEGKLSAIDQIVNKEILPVEWSRPFMKRIERLESTGGNRAKIDQVKEKAKAKCMRNLEELILYADKANLATDYDAKRIMLQELGKMQELWQAQTWDEMVTSEKATSDNEMSNQSKNMEQGVRSRE